MALAECARLPILEYLDISMTHVGGSLRALEGNKSLAELKMVGLTLSESAERDLSKAISIKSLNLQGCKNVSSDAWFVSALSSLEHLNLERTDVDDGIWDTLKQCTTLRNLNLSHTHVALAQFSGAAYCNRLETLSLSCRPRLFQSDTSSNDSSVPLSLDELAALTSLLSLRLIMEVHASKNP